MGLLPYVVFHNYLISLCLGICSIIFPLVQISWPFPWREKNQPQLTSSLSSKEKDRLAAEASVVHLFFNGILAGF